LLLFVVANMYLLQVAQVIIQGVNNKVTTDIISHFNMTLEPITQNKHALSIIHFLRIEPTLIIKRVQTCKQVSNNSENIK
jgi:hypothetical protein